jgi:ABC-type nitrate/sulfonate/bicarbonate transport system ATPase subunit
VTAKIRLRGVRKSFAHRGRELTVLPGIDLDIEAGEVVALLGPSGCGKTTLLRILAHLEQPDGGEVEMNPPRAELRLGVVFQQYALYPWLTVERNISTAVSLVRKVPRAEATEVARQWLRDLGLEEFHGHYPSQLSGGMAQRVALARSFALDPHLLLMDEPFAALDALTRSELHELTQQLIMDTRPTTVFVTHDPMEATLLADRVLIFSATGAVVAQLRVQAEHPRAFADLLVAPLADVVTSARTTLLGARGHAGLG